MYEEFNWRVNVYGNYTMYYKKFSWYKYEWLNVSLLPKAIKLCERKCEFITTGFFEYYILQMSNFFEANVEIKS